MVSNKTPNGMLTNGLFDLEWIISNAEAALKNEICHITDTIAPMSDGGKHDYYSNGDYWWKNPDTADGLPYLRRDGESNPEAFFNHRNVLRGMRTNVAQLSAAYYITGDERYAEKAVLFLKEFFIDEETKMNPHLLYAQAIPGVCSGRGTGIIDTLHLIDIPVSVNALVKSPFLTQELLINLKRWFQDYVTWLFTHPYGIEEMKAKSNHSVCWYVQAAVFAKFTNNDKVQNFCRQKFKEVLIPRLMSENGGFPAELNRTKPYSYSIFVLDNMVTLCHVLSHKDDNLWQFRLDDGRGIKKALEFLYPYLVDKEKWPYPHDVEHYEDWPVAMSFMLFSGIAINDTNYLKLWKSLNPDPQNTEVRRNMAIRQPILWL